MCPIGHVARLHHPGTSPKQSGSARPFTWKADARSENIRPMRTCHPEATSFTTPIEEPAGYRSFRPCGAVRLGCLERLKCRKSSRQLKLEPVRPSSNRPGWVAVSLIGKLQAGTNSRHHLHGTNGSSLPTPSTSHEALHRGRGPWGSRYRRTTSRLLERSSSRRVLWCWCRRCCGLRRWS